MSGWLPLLTGLVAAAVAAVVLWPLRAAGRRLPFVSAVIALGLAGSALYLLVGTPEAARPTSVATEADSLREGVQALEQALARDPQRADGWALLGRSQAALGNADAASAAFARAVALAPEDPGVLVDAAQARAQADPAKQFDDQALQWLRDAARLAPESERAGWLIGIALRQRGEDAQAAATWEALLPRLEPGAARALREQIAIARRSAGLPPLAAAAPPGPAPGPAPAQAQGTAAGLTIAVTLDPSLTADLPPEARVFVIARDPAGTPMPVAVEKHPARALPPAVTLDDGDSPMPTVTLSALAEADVVVRLSRSGSANRQPDDVESAPVRVRLPHAAPVHVVLRRP